MTDLPPSKCGFTLDNVNHINRSNKPDGRNSYLQITLDDKVPITAMVLPEVYSYLVQSAQPHKLSRFPLVSTPSAK